MRTGNLFENERLPQSEVQGDTVSSTADEKVTVASHRLAVRFIEDSQLPTRHRRLSGQYRKISKVKKDSEVEKRLKANVASWRQLIETMLGKIDEDQAWRFVNLCPEVTDKIGKVTDSKDFREFMNYIILRRDIEQCGPDELGGLALLSAAFQWEVEKQIPE
jgi:hypothetical protein